MTVRTIAELKARFEAGDKPTQEDFWDLLETMLTLETWPNPLPASSAQNLTNIPIPDPLPAVSGEFLTNINRSDWVAINAVPTYATSTSFVVPGDFTGPSYFVVGRRIRIKLNPSGYYFGTVVSATYASGPNTTTVVVDETIPTSALASVDVNLLVDSDIVITSLKPGSGSPLSVYRKDAAGTNVEPWDVPAASDTVAGLIELATSAETQAGTDAVRAVTPAGLFAAAVAAATANRIVRRDAAGRAQVVDPSVAADVATKGYVDGADTTHANLTAPHSATSAATASRLMLRDAAGRAQVADPSAANDIATKDYADGKVAKAGDTMSGNLTIAKATPVLLLHDTGPTPKRYLLDINGGAFEIQERAGDGTYIRTALFYDPSTQQLRNHTNVLWHQGNDGAGSGLDADLLDGQDGSYYVGGQSLAASGWKQLPGGLILQWGALNVAADSTTAAQSFPIAFPSGGFAIFGSTATPNASAGSADNVGATFVSTSQFTLFNNLGAAQLVYWLALGV